MTAPDCAICDRPITPEEYDASHSIDGHPVHRDCCPCWRSETGARREVTK